MILRFPLWRVRRHARASIEEAAGRIPKSDGSNCLPRRASSAEKTEYCSEGIRPRVFQLDTADDPTPASEAAAAVPPNASIMESTVLSTDCDYSHSVNLSSVHTLEIAPACELAIIHSMDSPRMIARRLTETREILGLSQAELCREIKITPNRWSGYENDTKKRKITLEVAIKLCDRYGITLDWIYRGDPAALPSHIRAKIRLSAA